MSYLVCPTVYEAPVTLVSDWCASRLSCEANAIRWWDARMVDYANPAEPCWSNATFSRSTRDAAAVSAVMFLLTWVRS